MLQRSRAMHLLSTFTAWFRRSSEKVEKIEFKTQREAAEFVRRVYNQNGAPNEALKEYYRRGREDKLAGERARPQ